MTEPAQAVPSARTTSPREACVSNIDTSISEIYDEALYDHRGRSSSEPADSTIVDPDVHQVVFENEHVRVIDARAAHGWKSAMHSHPPMLVIGLGSGRQKVTAPDGETQIVDLNPGMVVWRDDAFNHAWDSWPAKST
jgi:hypothetical protein